MTNERYYVGKNDGSIDVVLCISYEDALREIEVLERIDPIGVYSGEYYIDAPEGN